MDTPQESPEPELAAGFLGRPTPVPGVTYRLLRRVWRLAAWGLRARLELQGAEHLPRDSRGRSIGGWIAAVVPHRTWVDPFVPWILLPERPRFAFFGDSRAMARSPLRRFVVRRLGGVIPIPAARDPRTVATHLDAAGQALRAGMVFMVMPETGPPSRLGTTRRIGGGLAYVALRTGAPVVPLVLGGNDEVDIGRRIILRVLPRLDPRALAGLDADGPVPAPGSAAEREAAHRLLASFTATIAPSVAAVHAEALPPRGRRRRGRFLTNLFR